MVDITISQAVDIIKDLVTVSAGAVLSPEHLSDLRVAFDVVDHKATIGNEDALALLSLSQLMLLELVKSNGPDIETNGAAQLLAFAFAYQGRAIEKLKKPANRRKLNG
ncbi:hypothetical protein E0H93_17635 [Rhizobium leguminosarum bv. viciae]|uniref:hypothetical protein n=1 Tax=Rhizobium leguminosarum TaxID=384 RepID=UPI00103A6837|nr:hypothetical protein [Rhizobium leguminosarum]TCB05142.1 hypothetical protein E0H93_17635 [Rhizobium leguminosarum bv. viciae]